MIAENISILESSIASSTGKKEKVDAMNQLAFEIRNSDTTRSISLCKEAQRISSEINYPEGNATALANEGFCYVQLSDYELSLEKLFEALRIFEELKNEKGIAQTNYNLTLVYFRLSDFNKGLDTISKALTYYQKINNKQEIARCRFQQGYLYVHLKDPTSGLEYFSQSLQLNRELNNKEGEAAALMGHGQAYNALRDFEKSKIYLEESMAMRDLINDKRGYAAAMNAYMTLCLETERFEEAEQISLKGIKLATELGDRMGISRFMLDLGKIYVRQNKMEEGERKILEALANAEKINLPMAISPAHIALSQIYEKKGDYKNALKHFQLFHKVNEETTSTAAAMKAKSIQLISKIENAQKESEINRLKNVELKNAFDVIAEKNKDITDSINYALRIQQAMLPDLEEIKKQLPESFVLFKPRDIVSGDFYWFHQVGKYIFAAAADCTGHGVPGAFMSMIGNSLLNEIVIEKQIHTPGLILDELRKGIIKALKQKNENSNNQDGMDIALCRLEFPSPSERDGRVRLQFAGAYNSLFIISNGKMQETAADKMPIGNFINMNQAFTNHSVELKKGDALYLFSDGFADQFGGPKGKKFSWKKTEELLCGMQDKTMEDQKNILNTSIEDWKKETEQTDDMLVIGIKIE